MGWVYLDDRFPEHPKVLAAGEAAAWLYVCGLAFTGRGASDGAIPKAVVGRLVTSRSAALARRLVEVGLWHDKGDHYQVHDYELWNSQAIQRRAQARRAAEARWGKKNADEHGSEQCPSIAGAMPIPNPHPQSPSKSNSAFTHDGPDSATPPTAAERNGSQGKIDPPWASDLLVCRWFELVAKVDNPARRVQAFNVVSHLRAHVDDSLIDEAIGRLAELDKPPRSVNYLLATVTNDAAKSGVVVPPLGKETRR